MLPDDLNIYSALGPDFAPASIAEAVNAVKSRNSYFNKSNKPDIKANRRVLTGYMAALRTALESCPPADESAMLARLLDLYGQAMASQASSQQHERQAVADELRQNAALYAPGGKISQQTIDSLVARHKAWGFTADELLEIFNAKISDGNDGSASGVTPLDPITMAAIRTSLDVLGKADLYDFLGVESDAPLAQVSSKVDAINKYVNQAVDKSSSAFTATTKLVQECNSIFADSASRARYDHSAMAERFAPVRDSIADLLAGSGFLGADQISSLMQMCQARGIPQQKANELIDAELRQRTSCAAAPATEPEPEPLAPEEMPTAVDITATDNGSSTTLRWDEPWRGTAELYCSNQPIPLHKNDAYKQGPWQKRDVMGCSCVVEHDFSGVRYYMPVTRLGRLAVCGEPVRVVSAAPVKEAQLTRDGDVAELSWSWQDTCAVRITVQIDDQSPKTTDVANYGKPSGVHKIQLPKGSATVRATIQAVVDDDGRQLLGPEYTAAIALASAKVAFESVANVKKLGLFATNTYRISFRAEQKPPCDISLYITEGSPAIDVEGLTPQLTISAAEVEPGITYDAEVTYERRNKNKQLYFRLTAADQAMARNLTVIPETRKI